MMNMLIGVVCEVMSNVATPEKEKNLITWTKQKMQEVLSNTGFDLDTDGQISKTEFEHLLEHQGAVSVLQEVGVDVEALLDIAIFFFQRDKHGQEFNKKLDFKVLMDLVLKLRGSKVATVRDVLDVMKYIKSENTDMCLQLKRLEQRMKIGKRTATAYAHIIVKIPTFVVALNLHCPGCGDGQVVHRSYTHFGLCPLHRLVKNSFLLHTVCMLANACHF